MGRPVFWVNANMRVCAFNTIKRRNLKPTVEIKKALRYHYQRLADMGLFKSPTTKELLAVGIDTSTWNEGEGWLPNDMKRRWKDFREGKILIKSADDFDKPDLIVPSVEEVLGMDISALPALPATPAPAPPALPKNTGGSYESRTIKKIIESDGKRFKKTKEDTEDEKPVPTGRKWKGEHYQNGQWVLKEGKWFNPRSQKWEPGTPRLEAFYWIYEFYVDPSKYEDPCALGDFHEDIFNKIKDTKRAVVEIGRDHLKSTLYARAYPLYNICEHPELARMGILLISWDAGLASETFLDITENLSDNEKILDFYGYLIDEDRPKTREKIYYTFQEYGAKFGLRCTSFKSGSITGAHPWLVILDDMEDEPLTPDMMQKFKRIINKKLIPAVGKHGQIIVIGTLKGYDAKNDIYLYLEKNKTWTIFRYPAADKMPPFEDIIAEKRTRERVNDHGETEIEEYFHVEVKNPGNYQVLYKERFTIEDLVRKMFEMMDDGKAVDDFYSEYFLIASNPAGRYFLKSRIGVMPPPGFYDVQAFVAWCKQNRKRIVLWIDPGGAKGHGIAVVVGVFANGRFYFLDFKIIRKSPTESAETIARMLVDWKVDIWSCEGDFTQRDTYAYVIEMFVKQYLQNINSDYPLPPITIKKNQGQGEKYQRIQTAVSNMIGVEGQDTTMYVNDGSPGYPEFIKQATNFGLNLPKSREHDFDILDAMASLKIHFFSLYSVPVIGRAC